jgi:hypothetical protein
MESFQDNIIYEGAVLCQHHKAKTKHLCPPMDSMGADCAAERSVNAVTVGATYIQNTDCLAPVTALNPVDLKAI